MSAKAILSASVSAPPAVYVEDVFSTFLYTGTGGAQTITNGIDLSTKGGLVWFKNRINGADHWLADTIRGVGVTLVSDTTQASLADAALTSFNTTGFTTGPVNYSNNNAGGQSYASWTFRKQPKFFDMVTYTGCVVNVPSASGISAFNENKPGPTCEAAVNGLGCAVSCV